MKINVFFCYFFIFIYLNLGISNAIFSQSDKIQDSLFNLINTGTNDSLIMEWYNQLRRLNINENPEEALKYSKKYAEYAQKLGLEKKYAVAKAYEATSYIPMGLYDEALKSLFEAENYFDKIKDSSSLSSVYNSFGAVYEKSGRDSMAYIYFSKCLELARGKNDFRRQALALNNISNIYLRQGNLRSSNEILQQALDLSEYLPEDNVAFLQLNYANNLMELKAYDEAEKMFERIISNDPLTDNYSLALGHNGLGRVNFYIKKYNISQNYFLKALNLAHENNFTEVEFETTKYLHETYEKLGRYNLAYKYLKDYTVLKDSLSDIQKDKHLIEALTKFDSEKKQQEIQILSSQNEIKDLKIERSANLRLAMILGILALCIITFFAIRIQYLKSKTNKLLTDKNEKITKALQEKNILLREIHHRVKNNLQVISSLLKLQAQYIKDESAILAIAEGRNRVNSMALLHQNLYREDNLTGVEMSDYFSKLIEGLFETYNIESDRIKLKTDIKPISLDIDTVIPLGLIANELVSNALKHAFPDINNATLEVNLWEENNLLYFKVKDNGIGNQSENTAENSGGFGHKLIQALADKLDAEIVKNNKTGTEIIVIIKDYTKAE